MADIGLERSVQRQLDDGERPINVAHMFTRHDRALGAVFLAAVGMFALAFVLGFEQMSTRVGLGLGGGAVAAMATTQYFVLSETTKGLVLLQSSRIRKRATDVVARLPNDTVIEPVGTNLVITDYRVGNRIYSVMRRYQQAMTAIADR